LSMKGVERQSPHVLNEARKTRNVKKKPKGGGNQTKKKAKKPAPGDSKTSGKPTAGNNGKHTVRSWKREGRGLIKRTAGSMPRGKRASSKNGKIGCEQPRK